MNRIKAFILLTLLPALTFAEGAGGVTFRPPESDVSIKLLGYIFGLVDGVLYGTGSQIVGEMFGIFNAAVLALGAIVISYTTVISIINTAHQGTVLGKKWSTVMVPLRSVVAVGLLIPKASGYCSIQIFVMWVVVQGVGAADTIWNQALGYLARGGVLIEAHPLAAPPTKPSMQLDMYGGLNFGGGTNKVKAMEQQVQAALNNSVSGGSDLVPPLTDKKEAAANMLRSLICMYSLEKILEQKAQILAATGNNQVSAVPGFGNYINTLDERGNPKSEILIPPGVTDGTGSGAYYDFRGVCGKVNITPFSNSEIETMISGLENANISGLRLPSGVVNRAHPLLAASLKARNIGTQQMLMELSSVANMIVENVYRDTTTGVVSYRFDGLGFWLGSGENRVWVGSDTRDAAPMLSGYELVNAVNAYVSLVRPTLRLVNNAVKGTDYIGLAREQGWIMAGSYFYNLVKGSDAAGAANFKTNSVTATFSYDKAALTSATGNCIVSTSASPASGGTGTSGPCRISYFSNGENATTTLNASDINDSGTPLGEPTYWDTSGANVDKVDRYIKAALTSQETLTASTGQRASPVNLGVPPLGYLGPPILKCKFYFNPFRIDKMIQSIAECILRGIESVIRFLGDRIIDVINYVVIPPISVVFFKPLASMDTIFSAGLAGSYEPGKNPIVELAKTGQVFLTMSINIIIGVLIWGIIAAVASALVGIMLPIFLILGPILIMVAIAIFSYGIVLAFYVPLIPYVIFTFASIGWFIAVIEAMVAAPIVALGLAHPEGHETLGKADNAVLLLANVFLRPSLLVMGFIFGIVLSYVVIILFNAGFIRINEGVLNLMKGELTGVAIPLTTDTQGFSNFLAPLFMITIYIAVYLQLVEKSFELIYLLPDQVLSWIGGQKQDTSTRLAAGQTAQMKQQVEKTAGTAKKMGSAAAAGAKKGAGAAASKLKSGKGGGGKGGGEEAGGGGEAPPAG